MTLKAEKRARRAAEAQAAGQAPSAPLPEGWIDLGHDHAMKFIGWHPDRALNPQYDGIPDVERFMVSIRHRKPDGTKCRGGATLDGEVQRKVHPNAPKWQVKSWDPFHIEPSLLCSCGDHGFIRGGRWQPA